MRRMPVISKSASWPVNSAQWHLKRTGFSRNILPESKNAILIYHPISYSTMLVCPASLSAGGLERQKHWHIKVIAQTLIPLTYQQVITRQIIWGWLWWCEEKVFTNIFKIIKNRFSQNLNFYPTVKIPPTKILYIPEGQWNVLIMTEKGTEYTKTPFS